MPSKKHTSVVLNDKVQHIKERLAPVYGLKNIISAGLVLFDGLSSDKQKKVIADMRLGSKIEVDDIQTKFEKVKNIIKKVDNGTNTRILSETESAILNELRDALANSKTMQNE